MTSELQVCLLIVGVLALGYFSILPKLALNNLKRLFIIDIIMMGFVLILVGSKFAGADVSFFMLGMTMPWYVFTIVAYCVLEAPFALVYIKRYKVNLKQ